MKKRINIMLSEEALKIADDSGNRSEYIENLITGHQERRLEVVPLQQLKELLSGLSSNGRTEAFEASNLVRSEQAGSSPSEPARIITPSGTRTPRDILQEIKLKKQELTELLEVNQDPNDHLKLQAEIQDLWNEYHLLKGDSNENNER